MTDTSSIYTDHIHRVDRIETEVKNITADVLSLRSDFGAVQADVKALGGILVRIENGVIRAQEKSEEREQLNKPNLIAVVSVLITIISILVGGAWMVGGSLARSDERDQQFAILMDRTVAARNRESDRQEADLHRLEQRINEIGDKL